MRSIRTKIAALLVVPIVALAGLWTYTTLSTTRTAVDLTRSENGYRNFGRVVADLESALQRERHSAVQLLASTSTKGLSPRFAHNQAATELIASRLRGSGNSPQLSDLNEAQRIKFSKVMNTLDSLPDLRRQVATGEISWLTAVERYGEAVRPGYEFRRALSVDKLDEAYVGISLAHEFYSQADAILAGLGESGKAKEAQTHALYEALGSRNFVFDVYIQELPREDREIYDKVLASTKWKIARDFETRFQSERHAVNTLDSFDFRGWNTSTNAVLVDLKNIDALLGKKSASRTTELANQNITRAAIAGGVSLAAVIATAFVSVRTGRSLTRELLALRNSAQSIASNRLPAVIRMLRRGEAVDVAAEVTPFSSDLKEIKQVGRAMSAVQRSAIEAAVDQAQLRRGISAVFVNLARRSQVLLHRQLTLLDAMESRTVDPTRLEELFRLDHLTTRMRRHAEGLIILSGGSPGRVWRRPIPLVDVVRAAISEVEDYQRVRLNAFLPQQAHEMVGHAVADLTHLVAELIENAILYSPPHTQVEVSGEAVFNGFTLEVVDRGMGMHSATLADVNRRLSIEQEFDLADTDRLGLFVVSRLAHRHGIRVTLRVSPYGGTSAVILIPPGLLATRTSPEEGPPSDTDFNTALVVSHSADSVRIAEDPHPCVPDATDVLEEQSLYRNSALVDSSALHTARSESLVRGPAVDPVHRSSHDMPEELTPSPTATNSSLAANELPRRVPQANLVPQLRESLPKNSSTPRNRAHSRTAEDHRASFAAFQNASSDHRANSPTTTSELSTAPGTQGCAPFLPTTGAAQNPPPSHESADAISTVPYPETHAAAAERHNQ
ncbi:nitrate- and nitrite sensing domain-containing protein [Streptomyces sp. NPDC019396]|uniref:sensor histidine kinase n=1 Tax=Streptomyces sp. NPDC019396 TaxID=3154687 RepID=UPI0033E072F5